MMGPAMHESLRFFASTDVGQVRDHNEDNFLVDKKLSLFIVADGMGGHAAGEVASAIAVRTVHEEVRREADLITDYLAGAKGAAKVTTRDLITLIEHAVQRACAKVNEEARLDAAKRGMGTTLSALLVAGHQGFIAHVGDSRVYRLRDGVLAQLTCDHSLAEEMRAAGGHVGDDFPYRNVITRAIGMREGARVDVVVSSLEAGDVFLLCTDGLTEGLDDDELAALLTAPPATAAPALVRAAYDAGGRDNITAVVVRVRAV